MTLLEQGAPESVEGRGILVLETERLVLRPPRFEDAAAIAALGTVASPRTPCGYRTPTRSRTRKPFSPPPMRAAAPRSCF